MPGMLHDMQMTSFLAVLSYFLEKKTGCWFGGTIQKSTAKTRTVYFGHCVELLKQKPNKQKTPHGHGHGSNYTPFQTVHCLTI